MVAHGPAVAAVGTRAGAPLRGGVRVRGGGSFRGERGASAVGRGTARPSLSAL